MWGSLAFIEILNRQSTKKAITPSFDTYIRQSPPLIHKQDIWHHLISDKLSIFEKSRYLDLSEETEYLIGGYHTLPKEMREQEAIQRAFHFLAECSNLNDLKKCILAIVQFNDVIIRSHIKPGSKEFVISYKQTPITRIPDSIIHDPFLSGYWFNLDVFCIERARIDKIPNAFILQLSQCAHFIFNSCRFMTLPDFSGCMSCETLELVDCALFYIPEQWFNLPFIKSINLSSNAISTLPTSLSTSLKRIDLSSNGLSELPLYDPIPDLLVNDNCLQETSLGPIRVIYSINLMSP